VWVLTGDKVETAINIGFSSGLIDNGMNQYLITANNDQDIFEQLEDALMSLRTILGIQKSAMIVSGESLTTIL